MFATGLICVPTVGMTANLTRGPYLQMTSESQVTIRWNTDENTPTSLRYGKSLDQLQTFEVEHLPTTKHEVTIDNLDPNEKYFYAIYDEQQLLSGKDQNTFFKTAPVKGSKEKIRIWVLGDPGRAGTDPDTNAQKIVRDGYLKFAANQAPDFWMMLGDNAYDDGTIIEYDNAVFNQYPNLLKQSPLWPIMGNHDNRSADVNTQTGGFYDLFTLPTNGQAGGVPSSHEAYYSFDYGNVHVVVLNSSDKEHYKESSAMLEWLKQDLAANSSEWLIATFHHPVYGKSGHDSDEAENMIYMRERFLPILEQYGVDLVMAGHNHFYTRSVLMAEHYGMSNTYNPTKHIVQHGAGQPDKDGAYHKQQGHKGAVFITHGASAGSGRGYARLVRADEIASDKRHPSDYIYGGRGSIVLDIEDTTLNASVIGPQGDIVDYFTLHHSNGEPSNIPPEVKMHIPTQLALLESGRFNSEGSVDKDGNIVKYLWQFGDGNSSSLANTTHHYTEAGNFAVSLTVTDNQGASASINSRISVTTSKDTPLQHNVPTTVSGSAKDALYFSYEVSDTSKPLTVSITGGQGDADLYVRRSERPTQTTFDCRPYKNGNSETCEFSETRTGRYLIMVYGHKSFSDVTLLVKQDQPTQLRPSADANGPYQNTVGMPIQFNSSGSLNPNQGSFSYYWQFGDGNTSTQPSPTHTYHEVGSYTATLTVSTEDGLSDSDTATVNIAEENNLVDSCAQGAEPHQQGRLTVNTTYCLTNLNSSGQLQYQVYIDEQHIGQELLIETGHGNGNADIYYRYAQRPSQTHWDARNIELGNNEKLTVKTIQKGWHYIHIHTTQSFHNVSLSVSIK
ncbi:hypothetical protein N474_24330 [Pseudoalteromonas luteoviolacea CPMOR-2]|uniref:PKD domain-containing protein n=1 Tax=Pseudoalteromonas luteoviolacea DSM 6061 TaxID=1365250 RepID=A0A166VGS3_9GAMM|nr:PKD domain-containing protein [Pseudoalteromonas luteoviolacea]KZN32712.1 hypothetical protein N475_21330 [Pseudoalteromonas luteoviolacea DSM 6061]KZN50832.1 hypothetical protein N474_24330 [Pseudoalteromonas luteoviolacea CPMOR-2]MBE0387128.1 hypothetical protein [Pseudoalteromonas luteoviolacea DSM 6061]